MSVFLAIDLGTTGCRSMLFDENCKNIATEYEEYGLITPQENYVEQDAENWWEMTLRTAEKAIKASGVDGKEIESISISSQGITVVPVDETFKPLCNALTWLDTRAEAETQQMKKDFGEQTMFALTGKPVSAAYTLPKLLWLKKHLPQVFDKADKFLMPMDFLIAKFTGNCVTDYSMASGTLMYDLENFCWSKEILDFYGIDMKKLPRPVESGSKAGTVTEQVANRLGLKSDCVVAVGAQDQKCAAYGAGLKDGVMTISLGTAAAITKLRKTQETRQDNGVGWCGYVDKDKFVTEGVINTAGTCLRWTRDMLFKGETYDVINREAQTALENGCQLLFYPYLAGGSSPCFYPESTGTFYGVTLSTVRGDFALAVMEGIAFQIRTILDAMEAYGNVHTLILFGGGAKSRLWAQIISDATGMEICVTDNPEAAGAGAARMAAKAVGKELKPLEIVTTYLPQNKDAYDQKYLRYLTIEKKLWA